jgi:16S rRNA (cytosine1402-N4)-methyltransferase
LENSGRGFSFVKDEPLLMQMKNFANKSTKEDPSPEITAQDVVNEWEETSLADIIYGYGQERYARRIARGIVEARKSKRIATTKELVEIILKSVPAVYRRGKIHPATRTFQAIRIAVNDELGALSEGLEKSFAGLESGGRLAVISFHSLEDRIVKKFYKEKQDKEIGKIINKKVITASEEEIRSNPRSRSAKLRIIEKI